MLYHAPPGATDANASYVGKNVAAGTQGSKVPPKAIEYTQREIVAAQSAAGLAATDADLTQLAQAMSIGIFVGTFSGTANALTAAIPGQVTLGSLQVGMTFHGILGNSPSTGPATLNLAGFTTVPGAKPIVLKGGNAVAAGDLTAGALVSVKWDGTSYRIVGMALSDISAIIASKNYFGGNQSVYQYSGTYTWTVPAGVTRVYAEVWGAGGGGGGAVIANASAAGGGGGGYAEGLLFVTPGQALTIIVGAGGPGSPGGGTANPQGNNGGTSSIAILASVAISATGGSGGGSQSTAGVNTTPVSSGVGSGGAVQEPGVPGGYGYSIGSTYVGGAGGQGAEGNGTSVGGVGGAGNGGVFPGGGGNGGANTYGGGPGAGGQVKLYF